MFQSASNTVLLPAPLGPISKASDPGSITTCSKQR